MTTKHAETDRIRASLGTIPSRLYPKPGEAVEYREPCRTRPRVALYLRLSLANQNNSSITRQLRELTLWAKELGATFDPDVDVYTDHDISAKGHKIRPAIENLLDGIEDDRYDGVLIWEFSRWTRNRREHSTMANLLRSHGCELYSHQERWITLYGPTGMFVEWAAELAAREIERLAERISAWHELRQSVGHFTTTAPFGMVKVEVPSPWDSRKAPIKHLVADEEARDDLAGHSPAELVRDAFQRVAKGHSVRAIVKEWNAAGYPAPRGGRWHDTALSNTLRNPSMTGYATRKGLRVLLESAEGAPTYLRPHEPVVEEDLFNQVQSAMDEHTKPTACKASPLSGMLVCDGCGRSLTFGKSRETQYRCRTNASGGTCPTPRAIVAPKAEELVFEAVAATLADPAGVAAVLGRARTTASADKARADLEESNRKLFRLEQLLLDSDPHASDAAARHAAERYAKHRERIEADARKASLALARHTYRTLPTSVTATLATAPSMRAALDALPTVERLTLMRVLIEKIVVGAGTKRGFDPDRVTIHWRRG